MNKLSVLMSVYNSERFLKDAIDSVLNQTFSDFEFLIFEDSSSDRSLEIIGSFDDKRIKLIRNDINFGLTYNLQKGMELAKGKYVARMDADDICLPERFKRQIDFLDDNPDISILGTSVIFFDDFGNDILGFQPITHDEIKVELLLGFTLLHPSVMMRMEDLRLHKLNYNTHFRYSQDFDLWVRASRQLKLANLKEPLIKMREHSSKITRNCSTSQKAYSSEIRETQFKELSLQLEPIEKNLLDKCTVGELVKGKDEIILLEELFKKIHNANNTVQIFHSDILLKKIKNLLFLQYYEILKQRRHWGLYFWKSTFNLFSFLDLKTKVRVIIRTVLVLLSSK